MYDVTCLAVKVDRRKATSLCRRCLGNISPGSLVGYEGFSRWQAAGTPAKPEDTRREVFDRHGESTWTDPGEAASDMPPLAAPQDEVLLVFPASVVSPGS